MRRGYIDAKCSLRESYDIARRWAGPTAMLLAPSTSAVDASPWLERSGIPIGTAGHRHSRYSARPSGVVIAWCLHMDEVLETEHRHDLDGLVVVRAGQMHAPWITAFEVEHLGGDSVAAIDEPSAAIKATVQGLTGFAVANQGLIDSRERSAAVEALAFLASRGIELDPAQLATQALRNGWPGKSSLELAQIGKELTAGKRLQVKHKGRISRAALERWASAQ